MNEEPAKPSSSNVQISQPEKPQDKKLWILDQLTILSEALAESLTAERMRIYAEALADLELRQLEVAFKRACQELKFFPKIAELRSLAGASAEETQAVEADEAWRLANRYLQHHGVDGLPTFRGGKMIVPPALPARIDYALRRIGGLRGLNQMDEDRRPFMRRDFIEAYRQAPMADRMRPMLRELLGAKQLQGQVRQLAPPTGDARPPRPTTDKSAIPAAPLSKPKAVPEPLTEAQCRDRREALRQQAATLAARMGTLGTDVVKN